MPAPMEKTGLIKAEFIKGYLFFSAFEELRADFVAEGTFKFPKCTGTKREQIFVHECNLSCLGVSGLGGK